MIYNYSGFLSAAQVARQLDVTSQAIRKAVKEGRIDAYKIGKQWCFKPDDVERFKGNKKT